MRNLQSSLLLLTVNIFSLKTVLREDMIKDLTTLSMITFQVNFVGIEYTGGLAVWHVKDILSSCLASNNCMALNPPLVDLEEASYADLDNASSNGRTTHLFFSGNSVTFDNSSTPNSNLYDNTSSGISLTNISAAGGNMTLTISK